MAIVTVTEENFDREVVNAGKRVLLDFWASWCGPCRMVAPIVEQIAREHPEITVGKINVDEQGSLASAFRIESIPTIVVMEGDRVVSAAVGYRPKEEIEALLNK